MLALSCSQIFKDDSAHGPYPVKFSAYSAAGTRTGIDSNTDLEAAGFGIFAYYTDNTDYNSAYIPNFMYNQKVEGHDGTWSYSPIKYWPNEYGIDASSTGVDKLSFFAYAPYANGNIRLLTGNGDYGDPKIRYDLPDGFPTPDSDILWAVAPESGLPNINLVRGSTGSTVHFNFRHALSGIRPTVQAVIDKTAPIGEHLDDNTRITIEEVIIKALDSPTSAILNLNNTTPNAARWENAGSPESKTFTLSAAEGNINPALLDKGNGLQQPHAVTEQPQHLLPEPEMYIPMIPQTGTLTIEVEAKYRVTTYDDDIGSWSVLNDISGTAMITNLSSGNYYNLNLQLGIESMAFDVTVEPMQTGL